MSKKEPCEVMLEDFSIYYDAPSLSSLVEKFMEDARELSIGSTRLFASVEKPRYGVINFVFHRAMGLEEFHIWVEWLKMRFDQET